MRRFSEYEITKSLESSTGFLTKIQQVLTNASKYEVKGEKLDDAIRTINRRFNFPLKNKVIADLDNGNTIALNLPSDKAADFPPFVPFVTAQIGTKIVSFVNLTRLITETKAGHMEIEPRILFGMLQSGTIGRGFVEKWSTLSSNPAIVRTASIVYSRAMMKVADKLFGVTAEQGYADQLAYAFAKFFLTYCLEKPATESTSITAMKACPYKSSEVTIRQIDAYIPDYADIEGFFAGLAGGVPRLKTIDKRTMLSNFTQMFGTTSILGFEMPHYFISSVCAGLVGAGINSEERFDLIAGKESPELYQEITRQIR